MATLPEYNLVELECVVADLLDDSGGKLHEELLGLLIPPEHQRPPGVPPFRQLPFINY